MLTIVQNDPDVPPGILLGVVEQAKLPFRIVRPGLGETLPSTSEISALVVLGGQMGAGDVAAFPYLADVSVLVAQTADANIPQLGICLGGQILADALGGSVQSSHRGEKGVGRVSLTGLGCNDPLFHNVPYEFVTFQWHDDSFEVPENAVVLASSPRCPNQAFRFDANAYGVQFHPEVNRSIVDKWTSDQEDLTLRDDFFLAEEAHRRVGEAIFVNFLKISGLVS